MRKTAKKRILTRLLFTLRIIITLLLRSFSSHLSFKHMKSTFLSLLVGCFFSVVGVIAQELTNLNFLQQGGHTLIFRHSSAPGGTPPAGTGNDRGDVPQDSLWWMRCDANYSRQLSFQGRNEAMNIGRAFRRLTIRVSRIAASEFCRCYESAALMNTGLPIPLFPGLTMTLYTDEIRTRTIDSLARPMPPQGTNTVLVTHGITFGDTLYNRIATLGWSDAAVYRNRTNDRPQFLGFIRAATWNQLASGVVAVKQEVQLQSPVTEITISPNPVTDMVSLRTPELYKVRIINQLGQVLLDDESLLDTRQYNIDDWSPGAYTVIFSNSKRTISQRFVKNQ